MNTKELVDSYLVKNFEEINTCRENKTSYRSLSDTFRWGDVAEEIIGNPELTLDSEYVRKRFRILREKHNNIVIESISKSDIKQSEVLNSSFSKEKTDNLNATIQAKFQYQTGKENKEKGTKEWTFTASNIPDESEIIEHFNIDTKKWKIVNIYHKTSFGGKYSITVQTNLLKGVESIDYSGVFENFIKENNLKILSSPTKTFEKSNKELNCTVVINLADLHLGKLVSESETGDRYNIDIAKDRFLTCIKYLSQKAYQCYGVKKFILSTLGDTLHTDNLKSQTTAGTYVESDTRASKTFQTALELITQSVDILKEYAPEVEFININGNHCELSEQHLGIALKAFYRNDKSVKVNSDPKNRKHILIGTNLLTWNHGDTNIATLPLTIATEIPEMWGKSTFRLVQLGHLHSTKKRVYQSEDEFNGVIVRHFSSITSTDFWHDKNNFRGSQKRGTALVFSDVESGIIGEFYKTV